MKRFLILTLFLCGALCISAQEQKAEKALVDYINNGDTSCSWKVAETKRGEGYTAIASTSHRRPGARACGDTS